MAENNDKRFINIGTVGHVDHGKTTFSAAVTKAMFKKFPDLNKGKVLGVQGIDRAPEEKARGITINATTIDFYTHNTHFALTDCPGHADFIKNMIVGVTFLDGVILIVSAEGMEAQTKEHILLIANLKISNIAVFFNKVDMLDADMRDELLEMVKEEVEFELKKHGIKTENVLWGSGSALEALSGSSENNKYLDDIADFIVHFDQKIPTPVRPVDKPFLLSVADVMSITGRGTVVTGSVESGQIKVNTEVEHIRPGRDDTNQKSVVTGIGKFKTDADSCQAGDNVGLLLRGLKVEDISRGDLISTPNVIKKYKSALLSVYILKEEEGGRSTPFTVKYKPQFFIRTGDYTGSVRMITVNSEKAPFIKPGDFCLMLVEFEKRLPLTLNSSITIREGGRTIGSGKIVNCINEDQLKMAIEKDNMPESVNFDSINNHSQPIGAAAA